MVVRGCLRAEKKVGGLSVWSLQDSVLGNELVQIPCSVSRDYSDL